MRETMRHIRRERAAELFKKMRIERLRTFARQVHPNTTWALRDLTTAAEDATETFDLLRETLKAAR